MSTRDIDSRVYRRDREIRREDRDITLYSLNELYNTALNLQQCNQVMFDRNKTLDPDIDVALFAALSLGYDSVAQQEMLEGLTTEWRWSVEGEPPPRDWAEKDGVIG